MFLSCGTLALLPLELLHVELELFTLKDVTVSSATLPRARSNACQQPSAAKLLLNVRVKCASLLALLKLPLDMVTLFCFLSCGLTLLTLYIEK